MATRTAELKIQLEGAKSIADLEKSLKDINAELKLVDTNSEAFAELSAQAKKADSSLKDVKEELKSISSEKQLDSVAKIGGSIAAGMSVATVAASHFGKQTQESVTKAIQTATELSVVVSSIKPIMEGLSSSNRKAFAAFVTGFKESALGAQLFGTTTRAALTSTGIGLFVVALGLIVTYWDDIAEAIGIAETAQEKYFRTQHNSVEESKKLLDSRKEQLEFEIKLLQLQENSEEKIYKKRRDEQLIYIANAEHRKRLAEEEVNAQLKILQVKQKSNKAFGFDPNTGLGDLVESVLSLQKEFNKATKNVIDLRQELRLLDEQQAKFENDTAANTKKEIDAFTEKARAFVDGKDEEAKAREAQQYAELKAEDDARARREKEGKEYREEMEFQRKLKQDQIDGEIKYGLAVVSTGEKQKTNAEQYAAFVEQVNQAQPFLQLSLQGINDIGNAITNTYKTSIESMKAEIDVYTSRFQESISIREAMENQLATAQGERKDALIAGIDEEIKKEKSLSDKKKQLQNEQIKQQNKLNEANYRIAMLNAIVNGASGVIQALNGPYPLSIVMAALSAVLSGIQIGVIASNKPSPIPLLATGGYTKAIGAADETGHKVAGIVHHGEYVIPKHILDTPQGWQMSQTLEAMRTGRPTFAEGGFTAPAISERTFNGLSGDSLLAAVESANITVSVVDINEGQQRVQVLESNATL